MPAIKFIANKQRHISVGCPIKLWSTLFSDGDGCMRWFHWNHTKLHARIGVMHFNKQNCMCQRNSTFFPLSLSPIFILIILLVCQKHTNTSKTDTLPKKKIEIHWKVMCELFFFSPLSSPHIRAVASTFNLSIFFVCVSYFHRVVRVQLQHFGDNKINLFDCNAHTHSHRHSYELSEKSFSVGLTAVN